MSEDVNEINSSIAELRALGPTWDLKADEKLLQALEVFHKKIVEKAESTNKALDQMINNLKVASIKYQNANNRFMSLGNTQFVECRVQDDDTDIEPTKVEFEGLSEDPARGTETDIDLKGALTTLESYYDKLEIDAQSDSEVDSDDEFSEILVLKDLYEDRLLPHTLGSPQWYKAPHIGLEEDSETEEEVPETPWQAEKVPETPWQVQQAPEVPGSSSLKNEWVQKNTTSGPSQLEVNKTKDNIPKQKSIEEINSDIRKTSIAKVVNYPKPTLYASEPPPIGTADISDSDSDDSDMSDIHSDKKLSDRILSDKKLFDRISSDNVTKNYAGVRINKAIPTARTFQNTSSDEELFQSKGKDKPSINVTSQKKIENLEDKDARIGVSEKPTGLKENKGYGQVSIFGSKGGTDLIAAAIKQHRKRVSSSDSDEFSEENKTSDVIKSKNNDNIEKKNNITVKTRDEFITHKKNTNIVKDVQPNNSIKPNELPTYVSISNANKNKISMLAEKPKETKTKNKILEDLFADFEDDDLFSSIVKSKTERPSNEKTPKNDLFADGIKDDDRNKTSTSLFADDDDQLFTGATTQKSLGKTKQELLPGSHKNIKSDSPIKTLSSVNKSFNDETKVSQDTVTVKSDKFASLFGETDDEDYDLFASIIKNKQKAKSIVTKESPMKTENNNIIINPGELEDKSDALSYSNNEHTSTENTEIIHKITTNSNCDGPAFDSNKNIYKKDSHLDSLLTSNTSLSNKNLNTKNLKESSTSLPAQNIRVNNKTLINNSSKSLFEDDLEDDLIVPQKDILGKTTEDKNKKIETAKPKLFEDSSDDDIFIKKSELFRENKKTNFPEDSKPISKYSPSKKILKQSSKQNLFENDNILVTTKLNHKTNEEEDIFFQIEHPIQTVSPEKQPNITKHDKCDKNIYEKPELKDKLSNAGATCNSSGTHESAIFLENTVDDKIPVEVSITREDTKQDHSSENDNQSVISDVANDCVKNKSDNDTGCDSNVNLDVTDHISNRIHRNFEKNSTIYEKNIENSFKQINASKSNKIVDRGEDQSEHNQNTLEEISEQVKLDNYKLVLEDYIHPAHEPETILKEHQTQVKSNDNVYIPESSDSKEILFANDHVSEQVTDLKQEILSQKDYKVKSEQKYPNLDHNVLVNFDEKKDQIDEDVSVTKKYGILEKQKHISQNLSPEEKTRSNVIFDGIHLSAQEHVSKATHKKDIKPNNFVKDTQNIPSNKTQKLFDEMPPMSNTAGDELSDHSDLDENVNFDQPLPNENDIFLHESTVEIEKGVPKPNLQADSKKPVGKLKISNLNINVNSLLPGAMPKSFKRKSEEISKIITNSECEENQKFVHNSDMSTSLLNSIQYKNEQIIKIIPNNVYNDSKKEFNNSEISAKLLKSSERGKEQINTNIPKTESEETKKDFNHSDINSSLLKNDIAKERAKISVKRRPSTRRARLESIRRSVILNETHNFEDKAVNNVDIVPDFNVKDTENIVEDDANLEADFNDVKFSSISTLGRVYDHIDLSKEPANVNKNIAETDLFPKPVVKKSEKSLLSDDDDDLLFKSSIKIPNLDDNNLFKCLDVPFKGEQSNTIMSSKNVKSGIPTAVKSKSLFDSSSDEEIFIEKTNKDKILKKKSLFGDDSDDDLFTNSLKSNTNKDKASKSDTTRPKSTETPTISSAELVTKDPLTYFLDE